MIIIPEQKRGCGFRKVGGLYFVGDGLAFNCKQLPYIMEVCPCCSSGIKQSRGYTWVQPNLMFPKAKDCSCIISECPLKQDTKAGLLWTGEKFYTPESFIEEANKMGISKRIGAVPRNFQLSKTWIFIGHPKAGFKDNHKVPAIFYVFKPSRIEKIVTEADFKDTEKMDKLRKQGLTPVPVEDSEIHHGNVYDDKNKETKTTQSSIIQNLDVL